MLPNIEVLKGHVTEVHGSPNSGKTKALLSYIRELQTRQEALAYFIDAASKLGTAATKEKNIWFSFNINSSDELALMDIACKYLDIVVIDDATYIHGDLWRFMSNLKRVAQNRNVAIVVINQKRFVLNHKTGNYEYRPYRFNVMRRYCTYAWDVDTDEWMELNPPNTTSHFDDFTKLLLKGA
jgi:thymidine kinase